MGSSTSVQFVETALSRTTGPFALSYTDPNQKWLIRKHLLSLLQEYPAFSPSFGTFTHNDGTAVNLFYASGELHISNGRPPIPLIIWLHENYPFMPPMVFVSPNSTYPIHPRHPFVDPCGATASPYLQTWIHPGCNLSKLVHNLIRLFSQDHPFLSSSSSSSVRGFSHPSLASKREALDHLVGSLHYDIGALTAKTMEEIERLSKFKVEMVKRVDSTRRIIDGLDHEKLILKGRVSELVEEADMVLNWLKVNDREIWVAKIGDEIENAFEAVGDDSNEVLDCLAADKAIEDSIYALDKAVEQGVVSSSDYIRQVRVLAREQFKNNATLLKLRGPTMLHCLDDSKLF
ncbi:hypothetical protein FEM48_Zijuj09G0047300 [Ziziphus jujuba var. spinosa]|nr:hypothetical protein FEM48_Zijuj09G0047300 [Ziziphus jujuba var. spinosa]